MTAVDGFGFGMSATGRTVSVKEVPNGKRCGCVCPSCCAPLVAKQGEIRNWHFSHAPGHADCGRGAETGVHRMAKQIIAEWDALHLPELVVVAERESDLPWKLSKCETIAEERFVIRSCEVERQCDGLKPDVLLFGVDGRQLAVEVQVTHQVDRHKRKRVAKVGLPMIEYDLSALARNGWDTETLEAALRKLTPKWIHHPDVAGILQRLEAALRDEEEARKKASGAPKQMPAAVRIDPELERASNKRDGVTRFRSDGTEVVVINASLGVVVWACITSIVEQQRVLHALMEDATGFGLSCSDITHTPLHGFFTASGMNGRDWAKAAEVRALRTISQGPVNGYAK